MNGVTLMPTENHAKVRILLKQGNAKIVSNKPFGIQLLYETKESVEKTITRMDTGRSFIGLTVLRKRDGKHLMSVVLTTRNKDVPKLMAERAMHRNSRRGNRRARRVRIARRNETIYNRVRFIKERGTVLGVPVKYIKKKPARFLYRKRSEQWLTPTANHLLQTHLNLLTYVGKFVPISNVGVEYASFDLQKLQDPSIRGKGYQQGAKYGYKNLRAFILDRQGFQCLLCDKKEIKHLHHGYLKSQRGSNNHANIAGLCHNCHLKVHRSVKARALLKTKLAGFKKQLDQASILNTIMPHLYSKIQDRYGKENVSKEFGYETKIRRETFELPKEHYYDSYAMALANCDRVKSVKEIKPYELKQYRRHNRQVCYAVTERSYKVGKETVAQNRHKRENQLKMPSLQEYREELVVKVGKAEADRQVSLLSVLRSTKRIKTNPKEITISLGCVIIYQGRREVVSGMLNRGATLRLVGSGTKNVSLKDCKLLSHNTGIVCL